MSVAALPLNAGKSDSVLLAPGHRRKRGRINEPRSEIWNWRTGTADAVDDDARAFVGRPARLPRAFRAHRWPPRPLVQDLYGRDAGAHAAGLSDAKSHHHAAFRFGFR